MESNTVYPGTDLPNFFEPEKSFELLRSGAERYAPLRVKSDGSWRYVLSNFSPVAVVWTDWEDGFDFIPIKQSEVLTEVGNYVISSKSHGIPAGWAFTTLESYFKKVPSGAEFSLSPQKDGKLSGAQSDASGRSHKVDNGER